MSPSARALATMTADPEQSKQLPATRGMTLEHLECTLDLTYTWNYEVTRQDLRDLFKKAQRSQWISDDTLPWATSVDVEANNFPLEFLPIYGSTIYDKLTPQEKKQLQVEIAAWTSSQFLHGEQGALMAAAQLVASVPDMESKYYVSTQVVDEGRHVEVFDRYLHEKVGFSYPISRHLKQLLDLILKDVRWDLKLLGMQIMVEGLALAAFGLIWQQTTEPLMKALVHYVIQDEARHVAYGIMSLKDYYGDMKESDRREREDFVYEAAVLMRDRFLFDQVWEKMGLPLEECKRITIASHSQQMFRQLLFSKIVPAIKRIGLLSDRQRERFAELGILHFESWDDGTESPATSAAA